MFYLREHTGPIQSVAFSRDGRLLLTVAGNVARLWDLPGRTLLWATSREGVYRACFTADERAVFTEGFETVCWLWDTETGKRLSLPEVFYSSRPAARLTFSPDGRRLVGAEWQGDASLYWWSWPDGNPMPSWRNPHPGGVQAMAFHPEGHWLAAMRPGGVQLFEVDSGTVVWERPFPVMRTGCRLAFSPDGRHLAIASGTRLGVVEVETGEQVTSLRQERKYFLD